MVPRIAIAVGLVLGNVIGVLSIPGAAHAVSPTVVLSEVQLGGTGSGHGSDEFIEFYNPSDQAVNLEKWTVKYHSLSLADCSTGWLTKFTFPNTAIAGHGYWLLSATGYLGSADGRYSAGLASAGGAVMLSDASGNVVDVVGWGSANVCADGVAVTTVPDGKSLERRPGEDIADGGNSTDTNDNRADFMIRSTPEPQGTASPLELPAEDQPVAPLAYLPLTISELLVDPVSPATDMSDEYIELHNTNNEPVQAAGYVLKTVSGSYHLLPQIIAPDSYLVVTSKQSHLSLSNSGGSLLIADPLGNELDATAPWEAAVPGASWALFEDGWRWSLQPTPGLTNVRADTDALETGSPILASEATSPSYPLLKLNEVFPDPSSPQTDANNEFIELFNPGTTDVSTLGYVLKTGSSLGNSFTLPDETIPAGGYLALTSADTTVTLANSGSMVALYTPAGVLIDEITYDTAPTGQAWALMNDGWAWTTTPTPSSANVLTLPVPTVAASPKTKAIKTSAKKASRAVAVKKAATKKAASASTTAGSVLGATSQPKNNPWLLFILAGLTIAYIIYEFRYDLRNYYHKYIRHAGARS